MIGSLIAQVVLTNLKRNQDDTICTCAYCGSFTKIIVMRMSICAMVAPSPLIGYFLLMLLDNNQM